MKWLNRKNLDRINRALHRDLGYLFIGLTLIYGLSGVAVILRHLDINVVYEEQKSVQQIPANLSKEKLTTYWKAHEAELPKLAKIKSMEDTYFLRVKGGKASYEKATGKVDVTIFKRNKFVKFVNDIHYNVGNRFTWLALVYAFMLVFFAISGAMILKGKNGFWKRGIWFMLVGIAVPVIWYFFF